MATAVQICSNALLLLGAAPIASFSEASKFSRLCGNLYGPSRDEILRDHPWNCAIKMDVLAPLAGAPPFGFSKWFAKPGDFIRLLGIGNCGPEDYAFVGNRIHANASALQITYVANVAEALWDATLTDVMTKRMTALLAYPVTKSTSLAQLKLDEFERAIRKAKAIDGQENPDEAMSDSPFLMARGA